MYLERLKTTGDFLSISREHEWSLPSGEFTLNNGTQVQVLDTGVIQFTPAQYGNKDIVLSSGIHGNETAPIEICHELIQAVILEKLNLAHRVLFIFGNPASMNLAERFVEENLNRLFSGAHSKGEGLCNKERVRAKQLESYVSDFFNQVEAGRYRCHYDLHTAIRGSKNEKFAVYPFLHGKPWKKSQLQFLLACGVNTVLMMQSPATTFSYFSSSQFAADAFTVELGQVKAFGCNDMSRFAEAKQTLSALISQGELVYGDFNAVDYELFNVHRTINRTQQQFTLAFADDVENFTAFKQGELLAIDGEQQIVAEVDGEAVIFPNAKVAIGQRAILTVLPMQVDERFQ
ncbi:succinylglutamate desuccinylase [Pseudoalteromonas fenneropenaei]|uniref:Succinylglutamate desuccinylase n=1 Tax=Pseudoalteromonas fenneropenaei TaxID=1737459 RepID=A0ABV7CHL6_9GAMM